MCVCMMVTAAFKYKCSQKFFFLTIVICAFFDVVNIDIVVVECCMYFVWCVYFKHRYLQNGTFFSLSMYYVCILFLMWLSKFYL